MHAAQPKGVRGPQPPARFGDFSAVKSPPPEARGKAVDTHPLPRLLRLLTRRWRLLAAPMGLCLQRADVAQRRRGSQPGHCSGLQPLSLASRASSPYTGEPSLSGIRSYGSAVVHPTRGLGTGGHKARPYDKFIGGSVGATISRPPGTACKAPSPTASISKPIVGAATVGGSAHSIRFRYWPV